MLTYVGMDVVKQDLAYVYCLYKIPNELCILLQSVRHTAFGMYGTDLSQYRSEILEQYCGYYMFMLTKTNVPIESWGLGLRSSDIC